MKPVCRAAERPGWAQRRERRRLVEIEPRPGRANKLVDQLVSLHIGSRMVVEERFVRTDDTEESHRRLGCYYIPPGLPGSVP